MKKQDRTVELYTPEGERFLSKPPKAPWMTYPRPHLRRDSFFCLNGEWDLKALVSENGDAVYDGKITVPFVPEASLSGVNKRFGQGTRLRYRKKFELPDEFLRAEGRVILHFGAVDQIANVRINGHDLGEHRGGYCAFSFDISECLEKNNVLEVVVTDELENGILPYGKQREDRGGMWYTPISGIWQSVWLECVPREYIKDIRVSVDMRGADIEVDLVGERVDGSVTLYLPEGETVFALDHGHARIDVRHPVLWSPEDPHLYEFSVTVGEDSVLSYFALRTLEICECGGVSRLCLNGKPYFFHGLLDQGYFPDGIFLPASPEGFERDIIEAKKLGFNMLRKHIKAEPELFYFYCDRLGMAVFQDMVNNSDYSFFRDTALPTVGIKRMDDRRLHRDAKSREAFLIGMEETVKRLSFHSSVCCWTIFNEGWGQFDHASAYERLKKLDSSRFVDSVSGWFMPPRDRELMSDVESLHIYFKPVKLKKSKRPLVLSEFGGYSYKIEGHSFNLDRNYGYRTITDKNEFEKALEKLYFEEVLPAVRNGLCASVYTQLSDVEDETNGLMTYDRRVIKADSALMTKIADALSEACR